MEEVHIGSVQPHNPNTMRGLDQRHFMTTATPSCPVFCLVALHSPIMTLGGLSDLKEVLPKELVNEEAEKAEQTWH